LKALLETELTNTNRGKKKAKGPKKPGKPDKTG
jgi:hypothetical protein